MKLQDVQHPCPSCSAMAQVLAFIPQATGLDAFISNKDIFIEKQMARQEQILLSAFLITLVEHHICMYCKKMCLFSEMRMTCK
jgi:hypothetical protein